MRKKNGSKKMGVMKKKGMRGGSSKMKKNGVTKKRK
jgi:hypothetical protein